MSKVKDDFCEMCDMLRGDLGYVVTVASGLARDPALSEEDKAEIRDAAAKAASARDCLARMSVKHGK